MDDRNIFLEALNHPKPEERAAYLSEACGNDAELRQRVELLLAAHEDAGSFLEKTPDELLATLGQQSEVDLDSWKELLTPSENDDSLGMLGQYEILELIGRGGMGVVFSARDPQLNRVVAIKVLAPELAANAVSVQRFLREAQAAAAVSHDHVVTIHAIDKQARPPLIVMERIAGQSLQEKIDKEGSLDVKSILRIGMQTAAGLAAAHKQGLIHRDIKPSNILLENGIERVKLTDFGLARAVDDIGMTRTGQITGTPQYMSPEQAQGHAIDHRTDLFSLGCVLYAMCTGRAAFRAESAVAVMHRVVHEEPRPIREINEDMPEWLCRIIDKLMSKDASQRFASASEVEDLLGRHLAHLQQPESVPLPELLQQSTTGPFPIIERELAFASWTFLGVGLACFVCAIFAVLAHQNNWMRTWENAVLIIFLVPAFLSFPVGLLAMNAHWDVSRTKRYWWVRLAAQLAVIPWNPFLLLALPWTLRTCHLLKQPAVKEAFGWKTDDGDLAPFADSPPDRRFWKARPFRTAVLAAIGLFAILELFSVTNVFETVARAVQGQGLLVIESDTPDVSVSISGQGVSIAGSLPMSERLPAGRYKVVATKPLGNDQFAHFNGIFQVTHGVTTTVFAPLAKYAVEDHQSIEKFLSDSPTSALLHVTVEDPDVRLMINSVDWDIAGQGEQIVPLRPGRYDFLGLKGAIKEFNQAITLKVGEERSLRFRSLAADADGAFASAMHPGSESLDPSDITDWKQLLSEAASIPLNEWNTLSGDIKGPHEAAIRGEPLSLALFKLNPFEAAKDNDEVRADFWYLTKSLPPPREVGNAISISRKKGYVSFLQPEYITHTGIIKQGNPLTGFVGFAVPKLYSGGVHFKAQQDAQGWQITEFSLPNYGIVLRKNDVGFWEREASSIPLAIIIDRDGRISIQSNPVEWADLDRTLSDRKKTMGEQRIVLGIHPDNPEKKVEDLIELLKKHYDTEIRVSKLPNR